MPLRFEPTVTLVNRVRDPQGRVIPYEVMFDGESEKIVETLTVPVGIARILVHNSMFRWDPNGGEPRYKLAVREWGMDETPISVEQIGDELLDRSDPSIGPRRTIHGKILTKGRPLQNVDQRRDPLSVRTTGAREDGVFPGGFGKTV